MWLSKSSSVIYILLIFSHVCAGLDRVINQSTNLDFRYQSKSGPTTFCNSTVQGRHFRTDDRGYVCKIMESHSMTGCCPDGNEQYSCRGCNMGSQCCNAYEYCVACCLNPMHTPSKIALNTKIAKQATAGTSTSIFDYCSGRCRHNSGSVVHENAYASEHHHCFSPQDNSPVKGPERSDSDFEDLTIIIGRRGQSCDAACKGRGKTCKLSALSELNNCTKLKKYLNCKEACIASTGQEQPAEIVNTAPRHMHPGACMYSTSEASFSCQGVHLYARRLCPCE